MQVEPYELGVQMRTHISTTYVTYSPDVVPYNGIQKLYKIYATGMSYGRALVGSTCGMSFIRPPYVKDEKMRVMTYEATFRGQLWIIWPICLLTPSGQGSNSTYYHYRFLVFFSNLSYKVVPFVLFLKKIQNT